MITIEKGWNETKSIMNPENPKTEKEIESLELPEPPRKRGRPSNPQPSVFLFDFACFAICNSEICIRSSLARLLNEVVQEKLLLPQM